MQFRFYSAASSSPLQPKIDKTNLTIHGVTAMQAGVEALGHGCMTDDKTLEMMLALAQANPKGFFRQRFGHPGISENATGKQVARAYGFRIVNGNLLHDSRLLESARKSPAFTQDPINYILDIAEKSPSEFGESVVIDADLIWKLADGREIPRWPKRDEDGRIVEDSDIVRDAKTYRPITATTPLPLLRPSKFYYVDFVGEGALTHAGLFPDGMQKLFSSGVSAYAEDLFALVDSWRSAFDISLDELPKKADQLLTAYLYQRSKNEDSTMKKGKTFAAATAEKFDEIEPGSAEGAPDQLAMLEEMAAKLNAPAQPAQAALDTIQFDPGIIEGLQTEIADLRADNAELRAQLANQNDRVNRALALLRSNLEATEALKDKVAEMKDKVAEMDGEPNVSFRVGKRATLPSPTGAKTHPTPNGAMGMLFSSRVSEGQQPGDLVLPEEPTLDPAQAAIMRKEAMRVRVEANMRNSGGQS